MRVALLPNKLTRDANPYLDLLQAALQNQGVDFEDGSDFLSWKRLLNSRNIVNVFHFHWIQYHYQRLSSWISLTAAIKFIAKIAIARMLGYRVVWTMHNLFPHEQRYPTLDLLVRKAMVYLATGIVTHCEEGSRQLSEKFKRNKQVYIAPLGNYFSAHPNELSTIEARKILNISNGKTVFLWFGLIRPYKGLDQLLADFVELSLPQADLWVVGPPGDQDYVVQIVKKAQDIPNVYLKAEYVPNDAVQVYFNAADVIVLPFSQVLTSSTVVVALSFGRPVIAPTIGCIPEIVNDSCSLLYDPQSPDGLRRALRQILACDLQSMRTNALRRAQELSWEKAALGTIQAYEA